MAKKKGSAFDESKLTKGEVRKLNALRKSLGEEIADRAFTEWLESRPAATSADGADENAELIASTLWDLVQKKDLAIPRGGYLVRRGRGRVIVESAKSD